MTKQHKNIIRIAFIILTVFIVLFLINVGLETMIMQNTKFKLYIENISNIDFFCEEQQRRMQSLLCLEKSFGVSSFLMFFSIPIYTLFVFHFINPDSKGVLFFPLVVLFWIFSSELIIRTFQIPVVHPVPIEEDILVLKHIFIGWRFEKTMLMVVFLLITNFITALIGTEFQGKLKSSKLRSIFYLFLKILILLILFYLFYVIATLIFTFLGRPLP
jgi:hypothetical protein